MTFIRATRTTGAFVLSNLDDMTAMDHQDAERLNYTAILLHNGREIEVTESLHDFLQQAAAQVKS